MKTLFLIIFLVTTSYKAQVIRDTIFGKPKYVKEHVVFINDSGPYTFMQGDSEYGHAVRMIPKFLRKRMSDTWFETNFCRYINNQTYYDKDRKKTREIWFYKSGDLVDDYSYQYDHLGRLKKEYSKNSYSNYIKDYFYEGKKSIPRFEKVYYKSQDEPAKYYIKDYSSKKLVTSRYDSISKTDSIFTITNSYMKSLGNRSYTSAKDSIYRERLTNVKVYDDNYRVIKERFFDPDEYHLNKYFLNKESNFIYDTLGRLITTTQFNDEKYHHYILEKNGKYLHEEKAGRFPSTFTTAYVYNPDSSVKSITFQNRDYISNQRVFEYKNNLIVKLFYLDAWGKEKNKLRGNYIVFKYKFDKHKNWIECVKNVDGKDLYIWKREIEYYK